MKKILEFFLGAYFITNQVVYAVEKFEILPDLPETLATAQAASVSTTDTPVALTQSIGHEPNIITVVSSLAFVILLIYACSIIYAKLSNVNMKTLKKQITDVSKVSVVSTTALGGNKTLHVVELDGKRMLLGASSSSIQLLKDLGSYPPEDIETTEFSKIEIPNIRIPKIEIPKIEFPNIGFTKAFTLKRQEDVKNNVANETEDENSDNFEVSEVYEEGPDGIIDKLFQTEQKTEAEQVASAETDHKVDPDEYALYKKYL